MSGKRLGPTAPSSPSCVSCICVATARAPRRSWSLIFTPVPLGVAGQADWGWCQCGVSRSSAPEHLPPPVGLPPPPFPRLFPAPRSFRSSKETSFNLVCLGLKGDGERPLLEGSSHLWLGFCVIGNLLKPSPHQGSVECGVSTHRRSWSGRTSWGKPVRGDGARGLPLGLSLRPVALSRPPSHTPPRLRQTAAGPAPLSSVPLGLAHSPGCSPPSPSVSS